MTRQDFGEFLREMQRLHPVAKRERVTEIRAGVQVAYESKRGSGFVSLTEVIDVGCAVSQEMQRRTSSPVTTDDR